MSVVATVYVFGTAILAGVVIYRMRVCHKRIAALSVAIDLLVEHAKTRCDAAHDVIEGTDAGN